MIIQEADAIRGPLSLAFRFTSRTSCILSFAIDGAQGVLQVVQRQIVNRVYGYCGCCYRTVFLLLLAEIFGKFSIYPILEITNLSPQRVEFRAQKC